MSFKKIIAILGTLSMVKCFPPSKNYCTGWNQDFTMVILFPTGYPDLLVMSYCYSNGGNRIIGATGTIPWTVDAEKTTLFMNTTNKNFTGFVNLMHFNKAEWEKIPYSGKLEEFILSVNGTHIEATNGLCPW